MITDVPEKQVDENNSIARLEKQMKFKYIAVLAAASIISLGLIGTPSNVNAYPCAGADPCAGLDPCAASNSAPNVYTESSSGLAIRGTDPVAYFTQGQAIAGDSEYETEWNDAVWRFSSAKNQELFESNPEAYAPQYGGYCAKALSEGNVVSTDPEAWKIVEDKLYLNYSPEVQQQWTQDIEGNIELADNMWPDVLVGAKVFE